jgi:hypothetical protein
VRRFTYIGNSNEFAELLSEMLGGSLMSHALALGNKIILWIMRMKPHTGIFMDYNHTESGIKMQVLNGSPLDEAKI